MNDQSVVTEAMRRGVGVESEPKTHLVEAGAIRKFADAIGDPSPAFRGEAPIAPPTFLRSLDAGPPVADFESPYPDLLDGGSEWEYVRPVRAGDRITVTEALGQHSREVGASRPDAADDLANPVRRRRRRDRSHPAQHPRLLPRRAGRHLDADVDPATSPHVAGASYADDGLKRPGHVRDGRERLFRRDLKPNAMPKTAYLP